MSAIASLAARRILNSRGDWTVEAALALENGMRVTASVPEGKSKGAFEAVSVPAEVAVANIEKVIAPALRGADPADQKGIDAALAKFDGTETKKQFGANATLAVSIAALRAAALEKGKALFEYVGELSGGTPSMPRLFANVINGGLHAGNNLCFQEYLIIPKSVSARESADLIQAAYKTLGARLEKKFGRQATRIGDEGGYAPDFSDPAAPFQFIVETLADLGVADKIELGLDAAASDVEAPPQELAGSYRKMFASFPLIYLEDPYDEEDFGSFAELSKAFPDRLIAGDDLTVTSVARMREAREKGSVNAVIIKPNQRGTVSEALAAAALAREFGWHVVVSHRSGETNDDFIADFAVGVGADGFKLGAPARGERVAKYNRLLSIEAGFSFRPA